jgi:ammonia channel protein AmtB
MEWIRESGDIFLAAHFLGFGAFYDPGLAFFYGGMVKRKNVIFTMMSSFLSWDLHQSCGCW